MTATRPDAPARAHTAPFTAADPGMQRPHKPRPTHGPEGPWWRQPIRPN